MVQKNDNTTAIPAVKQGSASSPSILSILQSPKPEEKGNAEKYRSINPIDLILLERARSELKNEEIQEYINRTGEFDLRALLLVDHVLSRAKEKKDSSVKDDILSLLNGKNTCDELASYATMNLNGLIDSAEREKLHKTLNGTFAKMEIDAKKKALATSEKDYLKQYSEQNHGRKVSFKSSFYKFAFATLLLGSAAVAGFNYYQHSANKTEMVKTVGTLEKEFGKEYSNQVNEGIDAGIKKLVASGKITIAGELEQKLIVPKLKIDNSNIKIKPYSVLANNDEARKVYENIKNMPEGSNETVPGNEGDFLVGNDIIKLKVQKYKSLIDKYPGTLQAFDSNYQIVLYYFLNNEIFSTDDALNELSGFISKFADSKNLSTGVLVEDVANRALRLNIKSMKDKGTEDITPAVQKTIEWLDASAQKLKGTHAGAELDYIISRIDLKESSLDSVYDVDKSSIIRIDSRFITGGIPRVNEAKSIESYIIDSAVLDTARVARAEAYLGIEALHQGKSLLAAEYFKKCIEASSDLSFTPWTPIAHYALGLAKASSNDYKGAIAEFTKVKESHYSDTDLASKSDEEITKTKTLMENQNKWEFTRKMDIINSILGGK